MKEIKGRGIYNRLADIVYAGVQSGAYERAGARWRYRDTQSGAEITFFPERSAFVIKGSRRAFLEQLKLLE